jgi:DNA polymerase
MLRTGYSFLNFTSKSQMFDQAADLVLKALGERFSGGARLRASAESISRLRDSVAESSSAPPQVPRVTAGEGCCNAEGGVMTARESEPVACSFCGTAAGVQVGGILQCAMNSSALLLVGEAACSCRDAELASFGGAAGELLLKMLKTMGLTRESVNMVNVLVCESAGSGSPIQLSEVMHPPCRSALKDVVRKQRPQVIIAMGAKAAAAMFDSAASVESSRSLWRDFEGVPVMTTFHAAHLIRNSAISERRKVWEDLMLVMEKIGIPISERQRGFFL